MKANPEKCHVILSSSTQREIRFANASIESSPSEKLLEITLDSELKFEEDINKVCNVVNKKTKCSTSCWKPHELRQTKNAFKGFR